MHATIPVRLPARVVPRAPAPALAKRPGIFRRLLDAIPRSSRLDTDRELANLLGLADGRLTDEMERRMTEYFTRNRSFRP